MVWSITNVSSWRDEKCWGGLVEYFDSLEDFKTSHYLKDGFNSIQEGNALIDINLEVVEGKPLCVFFNGAQQRSEDFKLPPFSGSKVAPKGEVSRLSINDPALYSGPDIDMGWYAGSRFYSTQKVIIPEIIDKVLDFSKASRIIFIGSSSGGFASLYFSRLYADSIALVCKWLCKSYRVTFSVIITYVFDRFTELVERTVGCQR